MAIYNSKSEPFIYRWFMIIVVVFSTFVVSVANASEQEKPELAKEDSLSAVLLSKSPQIDSLLVMLKSGKPTLAYFYYSVACSCTAARCAIATTAIDSIPELQIGNDSLNFVRVDAYLEEEAEKMFKVPIIPAVVFFDKAGVELNRLEWGTNVEAITTLMRHPEIKQRPVD